MGFILDSSCARELHPGSGILREPVTSFRKVSLSTDFFATRQPPTEALLVLSIDSSACRAAAKTSPSEARNKE